MNDGTVERTDQRVILRYERRLHHPVPVVWHAITDPDEIERWTGNRPEIDLRPGGEWVSYHGPDRDRVVDRIVRLEPPRLLEHTFWAHVNPTALVTWELAPSDDGCQLTLTHGMDHGDVETAAATVAQGMHPVAIMARTAAGWHPLLDRLEATVDGRTVAWSEDELQEMQESYAAQLR